MSSNLFGDLESAFSEEEMDELVQWPSDFENIFDKVFSFYKTATAQASAATEERKDLIKKLNGLTREFEMISTDESLLLPLRVHRYSCLDDGEVEDLIRYYEHPLVQRERMIYADFCSKVMQVAREMAM
ncbi:MAG: hypothetical protein AB8C84_13130 [Oligoflexales bacterium]